MFPYNNREASSPRASFYTNTAGIGSRYSYPGVFDSGERLRSLPSSSSSVALASDDSARGHQREQHFVDRQAGSPRQRAFYPPLPLEQYHPNARRASTGFATTPPEDASLPGSTTPTTSVDGTQARAYRSRKDRPCDHCRKRKGRCIIDVVGQDCRSCQKSNQHCSFEMSPTPRSRPIKNEDGVTIASVIVPRKRSKSYQKGDSSLEGGDLPRSSEDLSMRRDFSNDSDVTSPAVKTSPSSSSQTEKKRRVVLTESVPTAPKSSGHGEGPARAGRLYGLVSALMHSDTANEEKRIWTGSNMHDGRRSGDGEKEEEKGIMPVVLGSSSSEDPQLLRQAGTANEVLASDTDEQDPRSFDESRQENHPRRNTGNVSSVGPLQVRQVTNDPSRPIFFAYVPANPYGRKGSAKEIGSQGLGKLKAALAGRLDQLIILYATRDSCAFPLLMNTQRRKFRCAAAASQKDPTKANIPLPAVLTTALLATGTVYDAKLRPISKEAWGANLHALMEQFEIATLTTLQVALTDLTGRPSINTSGNFMTLSQTLAISQMLGLHLDPSDWQLPEEEKDVRVRLWWAIVIHDKWSSLCWGRPSAIHQQNFSVPFPRRDDLSVCSAHLRDDDLASFSYAPDWCSTDGIHTPGDTFAALCRLTMILSDILDEFYSVRQAQRLQRDEYAVAQRVKDYLIALEDWKDVQPRSLARILRDEEDRSSLACKVPGTRSLQLSYLGVNLLLCRTALDSITTRNVQDTDKHLVAHNTAMHASVMLVEFLEGLDKDDLGGFYLHYGSHHLASCLSMLARLCLGFSRMKEQRSLTSCIAAIQRLLVVLTQAHRSSTWDLAELALTRSRTILPALEARIAGFPSFFAGSDDHSNHFPTPAIHTVPIPGDVAEALSHRGGGPLEGGSSNSLQPEGQAAPSMATAVASNKLLGISDVNNGSERSATFVSSPFPGGFSAIPFDAAGVPYPLTNVHADDAVSLQQSIPSYGGGAIASQLLSGMELDWLELGFQPMANVEAPFLV